MDAILESFLARQREEGMALAAESDLLTLLPLDPPSGGPPQHYIADYRCTGLVRSATGAIEEASRFAVGIWLPDHYLRQADPFSVLTWLEPATVYHPNISDCAPFICIGRLAAGTSLTELLYRCFEVITYNRVTVREDDALNRAACAWARRNLDRLPVDRRPLKRRTADFAVGAIETAP